MSNVWKISDSKDKPLLLFSSLDWGLGHTTRSIPLIRELIVLGCEVIVACNSIQKDLLIVEFPDIQYVELEGYNLVYGRKSWTTRVKILLQLSKILTKVKTENAWLKAFINQNRIDAVISDNRYGLYHPDVYSVLITHQLALHTGYGSWMDKISQKILYKFINKFSACWVPDASENLGLAGKLSHPKVKPNIPIGYLGPISRFTSCNGNEDITFDLLIILSGPEPQRSILETIVLQQLKLVKHKAVLVRGLPGNAMKLNNSENLGVYNHLDAEKLNRLACKSGLIVCRSGYTTIMDMVKLKKKMIVIPTPGQPEQEYLGSWLAQHHLAIHIRQNKFFLPEAIRVASQFQFKHQNFDMNEYKMVLKDFVEKISSLSPSLKH